MTIKQIMVLLLIACPLYGAEEKEEKKGKRKNVAHWISYTEKTVKKHGATKKARRDNGYMKMITNPKPIDKEIIKQENTAPQNTNSETTNTTPALSRFQISLVLDVLLEPLKEKNDNNQDIIEESPKEDNPVIPESPHDPSIKRGNISFLLNDQNESYQTCEFIPTVQTDNLQ